jgi:hypothetical protein
MRATGSWNCHTQPLSRQYQEHLRFAQAVQLSLNVRKRNDGIARNIMIPAPCH